MSKEAMQQALAALGLVEGDIEWQERSMTRKVVLKTITALQEALAEQPAQQEPVAWMNAKRDMTYLYGPYNADDIPLYTSPPAQRTWVGLSDEEIEQSCVPLGAAMLSFTEVARAIEAKLKEKNGL